MIKNVFRGKSRFAGLSKRPWEPCLVSATYHHEAKWRSLAYNAHHDVRPFTVLHAVMLLAIIVKCKPY